MKSALDADGIYSAIMFVFSLLFFVYHRQVISVFSNNPEVAGIVTGYIAILVWSYTFTGIAIPLNRAMMGAGDTVSMMLITLVSLWGLLIPLALILSKTFNLGIEGIWTAILAAVIMQAVLTVIWFMTGKWKHKKI